MGTQLTLLWKLRPLVVTLSFFVHSRGFKQDTVKIFHRFFPVASKSLLATLEQHGIAYETFIDDRVCFDIPEGHPAWDAIVPFLKDAEPEGIPRTVFTKKELAAARFLRLEPSWHHGYPQPEDDYRRATYDLSECCEACGMGYTQNAPFRMKSEPKWGSKQVLQLNWVFDEFFSTPEAYRTVFQPLGIDSLPVIHHKTGRPLESVVQLKISTWTTTPIRGQKLNWETCAVCHRKKLTGDQSGMFPHVTLPAGSHLGWTREYIGSGLVAWHAVIISAALYRSLTEYGVKGVSFTVVE